MTPRFLFLSAAAVAFTCLSGPGVPVRADSELPQSLDDQVLESLIAEPLDEYDRELFAPDGVKREEPGARGAKQGVAGQDNEDFKRQRRRELGAAAVSEEENPLLEIARQMRQVERLIAGAESGSTTQDLENGIIARLDELIKQARKSCKQGSPSQCSPKVAARQKVRQPEKKPSPGQGKPTQKPATDPVTRPGESGPQRPDMDQMRELIKSVWGELPDKDKEQMLELMGNLEFLPKYELLIEQYFKRLAEKRRSAGN